ncbi:Rab11 family-interacting protein 5 [Channa argus]|uniref:Rab11 family-interacting protein 5 n=1 Tax=Channa argus TaxID=215402 RepID=A0A6G1QEZ9_CHAAH|nr:Rab11 family-interacting protein 5 [Channa argus]KAK2892205.1 hypothetical protein Q8A73_017870 [Channa argus]
MSSLRVEEDQKWAPTHVQVTVLRGRGLRGKGKHGTSDVYTIIQLGKEKYSTCVVEKTTEPEWKEECTFELQPGVLERAGGSGCPAGSNELVLTVMHRALIGLDVFLGQTVIQLDKVFHESRFVKNEWYRLNSKTGKKEKERGDIQVTVLFTRNNLTASMYDLVMKDKDTSTFSKLKERMKGKRRSSDEDSSSAVLPSGYGSLYRMRQRLPSDGGGEEDYEDDEGGEVRRSKMRTFFLRGKLRKSSDTRSSTSLGSESSESSSRGGSLSPTAGISVVVSDLSNSPSNSSNLTADNSPEHTGNTSPKSASLKCEFGHEAGEISIAVPQPTLCVNGSHAYNVHSLDPGSGKPEGSLGLGLLQKSMPLSMSLQNLSPRASTDLHKGPVGDGRRWSFDKPGEEEKAAIVAALEQSGPMLGEKEEPLGRAAPPEAASTVESESQGKKQRRNLFSHGRGESAGKGQSQLKDESEQAPTATEEKQKGWFGSKDSHSKPSLVVSPKLAPSTDPYPPVLPPHHFPVPHVDFASLVSPLHHTNPFCQSQTATPTVSPCNPFFSLLQHNPFFEDMLTTQHLKPSLPPLTDSSCSRPTVTQLFPRASNPNPARTHDNPTTEDSIVDTRTKSDVIAEVEKQSLHPAPTEGEKLSNLFMSSEELQPDSEWDECFEAFAAGRLQSPKGLTTDYKTQQITPSDHPLEHCNNKGVLLPITDADLSTQVSDPLHPRPFTEVIFEAHKVISPVTSTNKHHLETFAQMLETIPEHLSFESNNLTLNTTSDSLRLNACTDINQANSTTNADYLINTNVHTATCHTSSTQLNNSSPDLGSSGLGSSAEEDFVSCLSSHSDKFSASSFEEAEALNFESNILGFEKSSESAVVKKSKASKSEDDTADRPDDLSVVDVTLQTVIQQKEINEKVGLGGSQRSLSPQSPVLKHQQLLITAGDADSQTLSISNAGHIDLLPKLSEQQLKSVISSHIDEEHEGKGIEDFRNSTKPPLTSTASSSGVKGPLSDLTCESTSVVAQDASQHSPVHFEAFGDFLNTSPAHSDCTLLHTDQRPSSFLQSLYGSTDSQVYQPCESHLPSNSVLELNEVLHCADSILRNELRDNQMISGAALHLQDSTNTPRSPDQEINQTDRCEESFCGAQDNTGALEPSFTVGDDLQVLPQRDNYMCCNPTKTTERSRETQHVLIRDKFSKGPQAESAPLHRSHSEGTLSPLFDKVLLPSFGSDPGAINESSTAQPGADLSRLPLFAPSLTPEGIRSPVVLSPPPPLANASVRSPSSTAPDAVPKPVFQETQQGASHQNSPHPVKPLTTAMQVEEKRTEGRSVLATGLEKLKSTISPGRSSQLSEHETDRKKSLTEGAGSYYHLTHSELVALLLHREAELERQKAKFERQKVLLAKQELELKKLKPQVRDLEDYIDTLLVRIMEQKPTLLQVRSKLK